MNAGTLGVLGRSKQSMPGPNNGPHSIGQGRTKHAMTSRTHVCFWMENRGFCFLNADAKLAFHVTGVCDVCWMQFCRSFWVRHTGQQTATTDCGWTKQGQQLMCAIVLILSVLAVKVHKSSCSYCRWRLWDKEQHLDLSGLTYHTDRHRKRKEAKTSMNMVLLMFLQQIPFKETSNIQFIL